MKKERKVEIEEWLKKLDLDFNNLFKNNTMLQAWQNNLFYFIRLLHHNPHQQTIIMFLLSNWEIRQYLYNSFGIPKIKLAQIVQTHDQILAKNLLQQLTDIKSNQIMQKQTISNQLSSLYGVWQLNSCDISSFDNQKLIKTLLITNEYRCRSCYNSHASCLKRTQCFQDFVRANTSLGKQEVQLSCSEHNNSDNILITNIIAQNEQGILNFFVTNKANERKYLLDKSILDCLFAKALEMTAIYKIKLKYLTDDMPVLFNKIPTHPISIGHDKYHFIYQDIGKLLTSGQ